MSLDIRSGTHVFYQNEEYEIRKLLDIDKVLAKNLATGKIETLFIQDLSSELEEERQDTVYEDLSQVPEHHLKKAEERFKIIEPLLENRTREKVNQRAKECNVASSSIYNWLKAYEKTQRLTSLIYEGTTGGKGKSRLAEELEAIIASALDEYYLSEQKPTVQKTYEDIVLRCRNANIEPPSLATIGRRVEALDKRISMKKREGKKSVHPLYPIKGEFPDGNYPLEVIQIDHTRVDIELVDSKHREVIGRPWITLAIDVYSRMIAGFYISFDSPGYFGTGQCLANAILSKDEILVKYGIQTKWPLEGFPSMIHMDNAKEFRGKDIEMVCKEYKMTAVWRPVGRPNFGGHIERLVRTLNEDIHTLKGTTFSNITQKGTYDSVKHANMTLEEFEKWLTILITEVYHHKVHSALGKSPIARYLEGMLGGPNTPPRGRIMRAEKKDAARLRLNLLPYDERTIQRYGIVLDGITYYSDVLNSFIPRSLDKHGKSSKTYLIRRDPRDISLIYFYDPDTKQYHSIPLKDRRAKATGVSLWEYCAVKKKLDADERREHSEHDVFLSIERMKNLEKDAAQKTLQTRKKNERAIKLKASPVINESKPAKSIVPSVNEETFEEGDEDMFSNIKPFEGISERGDK
ncbi:MAG: integrase (rve domain) [Proteobacteria bacterium]|nr:integrase (rve domain) [Pseudomonadota bacterium]